MTPNDVVEGLASKIISVVLLTGKLKGGLKVCRRDECDEEVVVG